MPRRADKRLPQRAATDLASVFFALGDKTRLQLIAVLCAGAAADRLAVSAGAPGDPRIVPFRGDYYTLLPAARHLVNRLIYPVPDPRFPFLGVHFTPRHDGEVWAGPNAVLALAREGYRRTDLDLRDLVGTVTYRGFQRLAIRYWRTGAAEMWRDICMANKTALLGELADYMQELETIRRALAADDAKKLEDIFSLAREVRGNWAPQ